MADGLEKSLPRVPPVASLETFLLFFVSGVVTTFLTLNWLGFFQWRRFIKGWLSSTAAKAESTMGTTRAMKMVLVVRNDLKMGKGKIGAQCAHAALGAFRRADRSCNVYLQPWLQQGQKKVVVREDSEYGLLKLERIATCNRITTYLVCDAGHTQVQPETLTVLAIGPAPEEEIDKITQHLKLL